MRRIGAILAAWVFLSTATRSAHGSGPVSALYVSPQGSDSNRGTLEAPLRTVEKAREIVRTLNGAMDSDITVYLRGGDYSLSQTLTFDADDSGMKGHNVIYRAYRHEKPVITGGRRITGWSLHDAAKGIYKAPSAGLSFMQLYVNGKRATRARTPNAGEFYRLQSWDEAGKRIKINGAEAVHRNGRKDVTMVVIKQWNQSNLRIAKIAPSGGTAFVTPSQPERKATFEQEWPLRTAGSPYYFENAYEFIDAPEEWYLNAAAGEVFYKARPGEDPATLTAVAPALQTLIMARGSAAAPVHHIQFIGLTFEHSTWLAPASAGFVGLQGAYLQDESMIPPAIDLEYADHLRFERNVVRHAGGSGIALVIGAHDDQLVGNVVEDVSGTGIALDSSHAPQADDPAATSRRNVIANNLVTAVGQDYLGSVGIFVGYAASTRIEHNEVSLMPYSGISVGWGWTTEDTALKDNLIRYNHIHGVMSILEDGGGVYTLSKQPGTVIAQNHIHDVRRSRWAGESAVAAVYLDNGSTFITVKDNVMQDVAGKLYQQDQAPPFVTGNFTDGSDAGSQAVIDNAGLEPAYRDIVPARPASPVNRIKSIRSVASAVEVEVTSERAFPVRNEITVLRIGSREFMYSRYPENGDTHTLIFTLTAEEFDKAGADDLVSVYYGRGGDLGDRWDFGRFGK